MLAHAICTAAERKSPPRGHNATCTMPQDASWEAQMLQVCCAEQQEAHGNGELGAALTCNEHLMADCSCSIQIQAGNKQ